MTFHNWQRRIFLYPILIFIWTCTSVAAAECSKSKVNRLAKEGKTITYIADTCDMDTDEVKEIIEKSRSSSQPKPTEETQIQKFPPGVPVGECGCWGPAHPALRVPHNQCQSGYAQPNICSIPCPTGGYMWRGVCS